MEGKRGKGNIRERGAKDERQSTTQGPNKPGTFFFIQSSTNSPNASFYNNHESNTVKKSSGPEEKQATR